MLVCANISVTVVCIPCGNIKHWLRNSTKWSIHFTTYHFKKYSVGYCIHSNQKYKPLFILQRWVMFLVAYAMHVPDTVMSIYTSEFCLCCCVLHFRNVSWQRSFCGPLCWVFLPVFWVYAGNASNASIKTKQKHAAGLSCSTWDLLLCSCGSWPCPQSSTSKFTNLRSCTSCNM